MKRTYLSLIIAAAIAIPAVLLSPGCKPSNPVSAVEGDAAGKVYVLQNLYSKAIKRA